MMAHPTGIIVFFVRLVAEWHHLHTRGLLGICDSGLAGAHKNRIGLIALHARDFLEPFNQLLLGGVMTTAAGYRAGIIEFGQGLAMAINTVYM